MKRRAFVGAVLAAAALAACRRHQDNLSEPTDARRVVSLAPALTETLFAIGAGDRVVGRSRFCDFPPEAEGLPIVGALADADLEAILQLAPDLVVGVPGPASKRLEEQLRARDVPTWFPEVSSYVDIGAMIIGAGERTGRRLDAQHLLAWIDQRVLAVERSVALLPAPRVLVVVGLAPIVAAGPGSFLDELTRRARATNVVQRGGAWQVLGLEQLVELDPFLVIDASGDPTSHERIDPEAPGWKDLRAVRDGRVAAVGDERVLRPGPRVADGLWVLARAIHPEAVLPHG